ncbi:ferredoxin--NADP reductase [Streptomyces sp. NPDC001941]|uniref:ferredoxin--NADP reductase n=1 Tax=Streptomyces sp. NPDC001941 TaxID=3154659 RepID=UPI00332C2B04
MSASSTVRVDEVVRETADAVSLVLSAAFPYQPGQFLTLRVPGGAARCYSLSSSPHTGEAPRITVKKVPGGIGSGWVCEGVAAGDELEVLPPAGTFGPRDLDRDVLLVAGGSGITPVLSIVTSVLAAGTGRVALFYANRDEKSVIFRDRLAGLAEEHGDRFTLVHWLESLRGLPTAAAIGDALAPHASRDAYLCGPSALMDVAEEGLRAAGARTVVRERYFSLADDVFAAPAPAPAAPVPGGYTAEVHLDGRVHTVTGAAGTPLLDAMLAAGVDAPYSCRAGLCGACACRVSGGEVKLLKNEVLDDAELADGHALACQAAVLAERVEVTYD